MEERKEESHAHGITFCGLDLSMMPPKQSCKLCGTPMSVGMQGEVFFSCTGEQRDSPTRSPISYEGASDPSCVEPEGEKSTQ
jgi:hypothetical protein